MQYVHCTAVQANANISKWVPLVRLSVQRFLLQGTLSAVHVLPLVQARNCYARSELLSSRSAIGSGVKLCSAVVASVATSVRATEINANKCKYLHLQTRYRETGELRLRFVSSNCREASGSS